MASVRPVMRGLLASQLKKHAIICTVVSTVITASAALIYKDGRMKRYEEFYKNYDAQKDFERMRDAGVFKSVQPEN